MEARIVYITCPGEHAPSLAQRMVETELAACVSILPEIQSVYRWEGKVNSDREALLIVKTAAHKIEQLAAFIKEHHPYSVPEFAVVIPEQVEPRYLSWLLDAVKASPAG